MNAAIRFEPEGFLLGSETVFGRQVAGNGFLRAAVKSNSGPVIGFGPKPRSGDIFKTAVAAIDPAVEARWISEQRSEQLAACGVLYRPDPVLGPLARRRLKRGAADYSLCGVTHTICTQPTLQTICDLLVDPVMPWDALICTSTAALAVVEDLFDRQTELMRWRSRGPYDVERPMTPIIPLGVHADDFVAAAGERERARLDLAISDDEVVVMFAGRLSISGKAHPYPLLRAMEAVAQSSTHRIALLLAGQAQSADFGRLIRQAAADFAPSVRLIEVDGRDSDAYRRTWTIADIFISLADSIQETFGITPVEAMAAGLPVVVSDWNGYKDTIRDGVEGFRVRTWGPPPAAGADFALDYEVTGQSKYSAFLLRANMGVAVEIGAVVQALAKLVDDPNLRAAMGTAGRDRARTMFDWPVVYRRYQALWTEQDAVRRRARSAADQQPFLAAAPSVTPAYRSPFEIFAGFPTAVLTPETRVANAKHADLASYAALVGHPLINMHFVRPATAARIFDALADGPRSLGDLCQRLDLPLSSAGEIVANLAKLDQLVLTSA